MAAIYFCLALIIAVLYTNQVECLRGIKKNGGRVIDNSQPAHDFIGGRNGVTTTVQPAPMANVYTSTASSTTTGYFSTSTMMTSSTTGATMVQGPNPPQPAPLDCSNYACVPGLGRGPNTNGQVAQASYTPSCNNKPVSQARTCNYLGIKGTNTCYGVYCLTVSPGNDYCICSPEQVDYQCATLKPGSCDRATGFLPPIHYIAQDKRFRQLQRPEIGSVYARHFAASSADCIRLCQWTNGRCNSINYGTINGAPICELLSVIVTKGSIMQPWLTDAPGWTYMTVVGKAAAV